MSDNPTDAQPQEPMSPWEARRKAVASLAGAIGNPDFPVGDLANLRRIQPDSFYPPAYWRQLFKRVPEMLRHPEQEAIWAVLMQAMAIMAPGGYQPGASLGQVLARMDSGTMEPRLLKLLSSRGAATWNQIRLMARMLANQGLRVDFNDFAELLFNQEGPGREPARRRLARDFFSGQHKKDQQTQATNQEGGGK